MPTVDFKPSGYAEPAVVEFRRYSEHRRGSPAIRSLDRATDSLRSNPVALTVVLFGPIFFYVGWLLNNPSRGPELRIFSGAVIFLVVVVGAALLVRWLIDHREERLYETAKILREQTQGELADWLRDRYAMEFLYGGYLPATADSLLLGEPMERELIYLKTADGGRISAVLHSDGAETPSFALRRALPGFAVEPIDLLQVAPPARTEGVSEKE